VRMVEVGGEKEVQAILKPSFGFGGQNACLLFIRP
jgi:3-oxoacyl-(acyl-carrier-protein) synthase